jgi:hypothetical protein
MITKLSIWTFSQSYRIYNTKSEHSSINQGFGVIMLCQCNSLNYNKHTTLLGDIDNVRGCACWGEDVWNISLSSS